MRTVFSWGNGGDRLMFLCFSSRDFVLILGISHLLS